MNQNIPGNMNYQQNVNQAAAAPAKIYKDISMYHPDIARGDKVHISFVIPMTTFDRCRDGLVHPEAFVYTGTRDMWILQADIQHMGFISEPTPLDTYRPGSPHQVSWRQIRAQYDDQRINMVVENRAKARNSPVGEFIARLSCAIYNPNEY